MVIADDKGHWKIKLQTPLAGGPYKLKTMESVKNAGMAVTMDIGERTVIHPSQKEQVGIRLAYWALAKTITCRGFLLADLFIRICKYPAMEKST